MKARYRYRFYPTNQQRQSLAQLFGCVRVVWKDALALCKNSEKLPNYNQLSALLTGSKKTEERVWLNKGPDYSKGDRKIRKLQRQESATTKRFKAAQ